VGEAVPVDVVGALGDDVGDAVGEGVGEVLGGDVGDVGEALGFDVTQYSEISLLSIVFL
jgi:hypothetical protein